ncbi:leucine-rich PPR motif-containing protein, mitochondrial-like isoform X2 [Mercenaria mercenaria]|uniref:leucine-rich PPR motif-containing protein, mitochondrial-like isoform X2 n=1 Tax=Mercenaria mercenaria TaxID=6596 RepID=UPI00234E777E|nr:leucine-rich PPR motif-containing protein, mitochondrial-like isoform X2 [Mercenaria mercenaria]
MSALTRCARYARVFNRSLHSYSRNITRSHTEQKKNVFGIRTAQLNIRQDLPKRFYAVGTGESSQIKYDDSKESKEFFQRDLTQLRKNRKRFKHSEDYPASHFWKKFDYSFIRKVYDFPSTCKNIYLAMMSQKGISAAEFYDFMCLVEQRDHFSDDELMLILKSVGFWNKEVSAEEKARWTEYLTRRFHSLGIPLDVRYYNTVLRNYLQSNYRFSPVDFMTSMEKHGVAPNAVTLSRFVIAYCKVGDIKSASQILEHMRSSEMSINAKVYENLILGNFIAGDKETAMQLFKDASNMGFQMNASMYHVAVVGHGLMGDLDGMKEMLKEAKDNFVTFSDGAYSTMIEQVAPKGRKDIIDFLMNELTQTSTFYYNEGVDTLPVLFQQGNNELALQYFMGLNDPSAKLFYKAALISNVATEDVIKYSRIFKKEGIRDAAITEYFGLAVLKYLFEPAMAILPHIQAEGETLRPQYLWPLIQYYKIIGDVEGLKKVVPFIEPFNSGGITIQLYLEIALFALRVSQEEYKNILQKHSRFNEGQINGCLVSNCLLREGWKAAAEYAKSCGTVEDIPSDMTYLIAGRLIRDESKKDWKHKLEVLASLTNSMAQDRVIGKLLKIGVDKTELKEVMLEKGITVNQNFLSEDFKALFSEEELVKVSRKMYSSNELRNMTFRELEAVEDIYGNNQLYKCCLLEKSFIEKEWKTFKRTLESLDMSKVHSFPLVVYRAAQFYLRKEKNLQMALQEFDRLQSQYPSFVPDCDVTLEVTIALLNEGRYDDAVKFLAKYNYRDRQDVSLFINTKSLFSMDPTPENVKIANQLLETLASNGYLKKARNFLLNYWNFISGCGDLAAILDAFEMLKTKYHYIPYNYTEVFGHFLKNNDKSSLQSAFNKFTDVVMEQEVLLSLAAAFLENKQLEKARKVLATPGMRLMANSFRSITQQWAYTGKDELIDEFLQLVSDLPGNIQQAEIVCLNLRAMCNKENPDVDACIRYFETKFDEEEVIADINTLRFFAKFLSRHGREVPYDQITLDLIKENKGDQPVVKASRPRAMFRQKKEPEPTKPAEKKKKPEPAKPAEKTSAEEANDDTLLLLLKRREFKRALKKCETMSTDEIKMMLPDDEGLLTKWAEFLVRGNKEKILECLPEEIQTQAINGVCDKVHKEKATVPIDCYRFLLEKQPDRVLSCVPEMDLVNQTKLFVASLFTEDSALSKSVKEMIKPEREKVFFLDAYRRMGDMMSNIQKKLSDWREPYFILIDSFEDKNILAVGVSHLFSKFAGKNDFEGLGVLAEKANSYGLTFEEVANLMPEKGRPGFISTIVKAEETLKAENKPVPWEPSSNWTVTEKQAEVGETKVESTDITTEKAVTDIATKVDDHTEIAIPKENPVEVTVKQTEKTEIFTVKKDTEEIVDTAKTVSMATESEMKDEATVISEDRSELGSKSEFTKDQS